MAPRKGTPDQLAGAARAALGGGRRLEAVERLAGGTTKGVYRLTMDDATTAIAYLWQESENYWPAAEGDGDLADPFSPGVGLDLFEASHACLTSLGVRVRPRAEYSVVHGELGLDHVLVDRNGDPVVIDIEELLYFDVEWEHVFLRLRHSEDQYRWLAVEDLDEDRLALYKLTQHLSLTAGPLRLLDGDFPDRAFMQGIAEHHLNETLAQLSPAL